MIPCYTRYHAIDCFHGDWSVSESLRVQLKKGVLDLCVLALLSRQDSYAYEIASRLAEDVGMGEGTIYPLMRRLQGEGLVTTYLVESNSGPSRKYYRLTAAGRKAYALQRADWEDFVMSINRTLGDHR
jgi:PadR family transcriptional regulator PadR